MNPKLFFSLSLLFLILFTCCTKITPTEQEPLATPGISHEVTPTGPESLVIPDTSPEVTPVNNQVEYIKLTPQEAQAMMSDNVIILDVSIQDGYDGDHHIKDAVLLPDYEIREKAESVITDKNRTVLVCCKTGIKSETASKELIEMGYTNVFDIGSIFEWTGELVFDVTGRIFYNYFGGELPPDIFTPIDFTVNKKINEQLPEFTFNIRGVNEKKYQLNAWGNRYYIGWDMNVIDSIIITSEDGKYNQELTDLDNTLFTFYEMFGVSFDDWNFDGYLDISLQREYYFGSSSPHFYWLWDNDKGEFVRNAELEEFSDTTFVTIDEENSLVQSFKGRQGFYEYKYYKYENSKYVLAKQINIDRVKGKEDKYTRQITAQELINGEMIIIDEYYEEFPIENGAELDAGLLINNTENEMD